MSKKNEWMLLLILLAMFKWTFYLIIFDLENVVEAMSDSLMPGTSVEITLIFVEICRTSLI